MSKLWVDIRMISGTYLAMLLKDANVHSNAYKRVWLQQHLAENYKK